MLGERRLRFVFEDAPLVLGRLQALIGDDALGRRRPRGEARAAAGLSGGGKAFAAIGHGDLKSGEGLKTLPYAKRITKD